MPGGDRALNTEFDAVLELYSKGIMMSIFDLNSDHSLEEVGTLSKQEMQLASRMDSPVQRHRYISACVEKRRFLSYFLDCRPEEVTYSKGSCGKPYANSHNKSSGDIKLFDFNVSHSDNLMVAVVGTDSVVGVDIEFVREEYLFPDLDVLFPEIGDYGSYDYENGPYTAQSFFTNWTFLEARRKLDGMGLGCQEPLNNFPENTVDIYRIQFESQGNKVVGTVAAHTPAKGEGIIR